jgi:transcription elongation factor Elf1
MTLPRPFECPACGHDRIVQRPHELHTESGQLRVRLTKWVCGLCSYQWSMPACIARPARVDDWERA